MTATAGPSRVLEAARTALPTRYGHFQAIGFFDYGTGEEHLALVSPLGLGPPREPPIVRVQSECLTGEVFGSQRCDCRLQLDLALSHVARNPGLIIYLRGQEGRGVGLLAKLEAYTLQDQGLDTVDAQLQLGLPIDDREYGAAAAILDSLGRSRIRLLTNNPRKVAGLGVAGIDVIAVEPLLTPPTPSNVGYLRAKRDRLGHHLPADLDRNSGRRPRH